MKSLKFVIKKRNAKSKKKIRRREFKAFKIKTQGFKFNRDEIYDSI